ncbi:MAG: YdcH family protein [Sphingorhabdus sp.]
MNDDGYQQQLEQLKIEHRDLDDAIKALTMQSVIDQLQIARLKKKKLVLKDRIMRLEDQLVPDIIA